MGVVDINVKLDINMLTNIFYLDNLHLKSHLTRVARGLIIYLFLVQCQK
jgi:hypothetical protein